MASNNNEGFFADRRRSASRRSEYSLSRIGADRRRLAHRRRNNSQYADTNWWLRVDYFDGYYMIKPGAKVSDAVLKNPDSLQKL